MSEDYLPHPLRQVACCCYARKKITVSGVLLSPRVIIAIYILISAQDGASQTRFTLQAKTAPASDLEYSKCMGAMSMRGGTYNLHAISEFRAPARALIQLSLLRLCYKSLESIWLKVSTLLEQFFRDRGRRMQTKCILKKREDGGNCRIRNETHSVIPFTHVVVIHNVKLIVLLNSHTSRMLSAPGSRSQS